MQLAFPWALPLLLPVLKMAADRFRRRGDAAVRFSSLEAFRQVPRTARQRVMPLLFWLQVLAVSLLVFAAARPQVRDMTTGIPREGVAIELVVDISSSMDISSRPASPVPKLTVPDLSGVVWIVRLSRCRLARITRGD